MPLYCTAQGKALLADADERALVSQFGRGPLQRYTPSSISSIKALAIECAAIKRLWAITPQGELRIFLDEGDAAKVDALEKQFFAGAVTEDVLFATGRGVAPWMASVTFGGPTLETLYIGSLNGTRIPFLTAPVPGLPMVHWNDRYA